MLTREAIADYEFVRSLGEGNYGEFYLAKTPSRLPVDEEFVAVKVLVGNTSDEIFRRATRELKSFASVHSRYLVRLYDAGQQGGTFYYAMQYHPLGSLATPARPLSRAEVLRACRHVALAAHDLHQAGIVHRDIKPTNVLLHEDGAHLSDLGLAQLLNPGQTMTGVGSVGAVEYLDPTIIHGGQASRATDIWSIGATLHRALTGHGIYGELPDRDPLLALRRVLSSEPQISPNLSDADTAVIAACLDPDPTARPATAAEVAALIEGLPTE